MVVTDVKIDGKDTIYKCNQGTVVFLVKIFNAYCSLAIKKLFVSILIIPI